MALNVLSRHIATLEVPLPLGVGADYRAEGRKLILRAESFRSPTEATAFLSAVAHNVDATLLDSEHLSDETRAQVRARYQVLTDALGETAREAGDRG